MRHQISLFQNWFGVLKDFFGVLLHGTKSYISKIQEGMWRNATGDKEEKVTFIQPGLDLDNG